MCNGLRGKNTMELTYSGKLSASQAKTKRGQAGCVPGYCKKLGQPGLNSCDEFPFASTDEGGNVTPSIERAIACIPGVQNSFQGGKLGSFIKNQGLTQGDRYVISIDCDKVLGSINGKRAEAANIRARDVVPQTSGSPGPDAVFGPSYGLDGGSSFVVAGFGDLDPGIYNATAQVVTGSVSGGFLTDNLGNNLSTLDTALNAGDTQQFSFTIDQDGALNGVGLLLATGNNSTNITWTFTGQDLPPSQQTGTTGGASPTATDGGEDPFSGIGAASSILDFSPLHYGAFLTLTISHLFLQL